MDVMGYTVLSEETLPNFLKGKPQVVTCLAFAAAFLMVTALSVTIGIFIGYTYCYLEHRSGIVKANLTRTNVQILHVPVHELRVHDNKSRTINEAFRNNYIVAKVLASWPQWSQKVQVPGAAS